MSAFMVSKSHIDALVHAAYFGPRDVRGLPQQAGHWYKPQFRGCQNWGFEQMNEVGEMAVPALAAAIVLIVFAARSCYFSRIRAIPA